MANVSFGDAAREQLRALVDTIDREITSSPAGGTTPVDPLRASWTELVKALALGPKVETRECPVCHGSGMRAASRCSHCWTKLAPLAALSDDVAPAPAATAAPRGDA